MLLNFRLNSKNPEIRKKALAEIKDDTQLIQFAENECDWEVKKIALSYVRDTQLIWNMSLDINSSMSNIATYVFACRMHKRAQENPINSNELYCNITELCIEKAKIATNQAFLDFADCFYRDEDIADFLIELSKLYETAINDFGTKVVNTYPYKGYSQIGKDLSKKLTDSKQIMRCFTVSCPFIYYEKIYDINDNEVLKNIIEKTKDEFITKEAEKLLLKLGEKNDIYSYELNLKENNDSRALLVELINEKEDINIIKIANRIIEINDKNIVLQIEDSIIQINENRQVYNPQLRASLISIYSSLKGMQFDDAWLYFADEYDVKELEKKLNSDNSTSQLIAVDKLQRLYKMGKFKLEISKIEYKGKPVKDYKDPYGPQIVV